MEYPLTSAEYRTEKRRYDNSRPVAEKPTALILKGIAAEYRSGLLTDEEYITRTAMVCFDYAVDQHAA